MYPVAVSGRSPWSEALIHDLSANEFRNEYMMDQVRSFIAFQIRALREQPGRKWSQGDLAEKSQKTQSVISRMEDPDYGKLSLQSLLEIAIAFDLPLLVQFVEWDDWLSRMSNLSPSALRKRSFDAARLIDLVYQEQNMSSAQLPISERSPIQSENLGASSGSSASANAALGPLKRVPEGHSFQGAPA